MLTNLLKSLCKIGDSHVEKVAKLSKEKMIKLTKGKTTNLSFCNMKKGDLTNGTKDGPMGMSLFKRLPHAMPS